MITCIFNEHCGYRLLLDVLLFVIKLYVQLSKDRLELQAKVDVVKNMDMDTKVKQFGVNMQEQVIIVCRPFLDFMDSFKFAKTHNMLAFMLDPKFKDLSLVGNYAGHFLAIEITCAYNSQFLLPTFKSL